MDDNMIGLWFYSVVAAGLALWAVTTGHPIIAAILIILCPAFWFLILLAIALVPVAMVIYFCLRLCDVWGHHISVISN